jgi:putative tryptophan/tyrosine transport system substrate-binding protein
VTSYLIREERPFAEVRRQVAVIIAVGSTNSPRAARAATSAIPIVFAVGSDPVDTGLVTNLRRPEANLTGVTFNITALAPKRLEIVNELLPGGTPIGYLRNATNTFDTDMAGLTAAARTLGRQISVFDASTEQEINLAFGVGGPPLRDHPRSRMLLKVMKGG